MSKLVSAKVEGLGLDLRKNSPVMVLRPKNEQDERRLMIWIGPFEASMITSEMMGVRPNRPMTHDLLLTVIKASGARLEKVSVTTLTEGTYYAKLHLVVDGVTTLVDVRPSDAVALALRAEAPIWVEDSLFPNVAYRVDPDSPGQPGAPKPATENAEALKERLRNLKPEDFGRTH